MGKETFSKSPRLSIMFLTTLLDQRGKQEETMR